jgi:hypothetical protein
MVVAKVVVVVVVVVDMIGSLSSVLFAELVHLFSVVLTLMIQPHRLNHLGYPAPFVSYVAEYLIFFSHHLGIFYTSKKTLQIASSQIIRWFDTG